MTIATDRPLPRLRPIDIAPIDDNGEIAFVLRDMTRIAPQAMALSGAGYFIVAHFDGENDIGAIQRAFLQQFGQSINPEQVVELATTLDEALMLETDRFQHAYAQRAAEYLAADARDNRERWPDADEMGEEIAAALTDGRAVKNEEVLRGVIAPHLDYPRGAPCYADAYATLREAGPADRYVILGTNHFGRSHSVVATRKDFVTPLGRVGTDRAFLEELDSRVGGGLFDHEFDHDAEHSIELQVHLLQTLFPDAEFEIVAALCPDPCGPTGTAPADGNGADLGEFADALAEMIASDHARTVVIASADFSHVGQRFGDEDPTTEDFLANVGLY
ncbi:MAG: AmmeMemoRadiSam system protein B, partial [Phycisphaerales bacterium]|nr:AmmeMemoRadiSam system protein B [Phycisphaerales bacterium]